MAIVLLWIRVAGEAVVALEVMPKKDDAVDAALMLFAVVVLPITFPVRV